MVIAPLSADEVFRLHVLVAQTGLQLQAAQLLPQFHEGRHVSLVLLVVAVGDVALSVFEVIGPLRIGEFLANLYLPFPQRMAHDEFLGHHAASRQVVDADVAVVVLLAQFLLRGEVVLMAEGVVGVEVDVHLANLAHVVEVHLVARKAFLTLHAVVYEVVIHVAVGQQFVGVGATDLHVVVGVFVISAEGTVVVQLVVETGAPFQEGVAYGEVLTVLDAPERVGKDGLLELARLPPLVVGSEEVGEEFQPARAISQVQALVVLIAVALATPRRQLHAQALAGSPTGADDDDRLHRGIVARTGILHDLHRADEVRLDVAQLLQVGKLSVVHVDERHTLAQNLEAVAFLRNHRHAGEHILGCAQALHHGAFDVHHERVAVKLHLRTLTLHRDAVDGVALRLQADGAEVLTAALPPHGLVAHVGDAGQNGRLFNRYGEVAALVRHATAEQRGVGCIHHGHVGIGHGQPLLVDDGARQVAVGLMGALHVEFPFATPDHADGIEPHDLLNGIGQRLVTDGGGHAEVFQLVVEEADRVVGRQLAEVAQHLGHGYVSVAARNLLRLHLGKAAKEHENGDEMLHLTISFPFSTTIVTCSNMFNFSTTSCRPSVWFHTK